MKSVFGHMKLKSHHEVIAALRHNDRSGRSHNHDPERSHLNEDLLADGDLAPGETWAQRIDQRLADLGNPKLNRSNDPTKAGVLGRERVLSASKSYFEGDWLLEHWSGQIDKRLQDPSARRAEAERRFLLAVRGFIDAEGRGSAYLQVRVHRDEGSLHVQVVDLALTQEVDRRRKSPEPVWRFSAFKLFGGDKQALTDHHQRWLETLRSFTGAPFQDFERGADKLPKQERTVEAFKQQLLSEIAATEDKAARLDVVDDMLRQQRQQLVGDQAKHRDQVQRDSAGLKAREQDLDRRQVQVEGRERAADGRERQLDVRADGLDQRDRALAQREADEAAKAKAAEAERQQLLDAARREADSLLKAARAKVEKTLADLKAHVDKVWQDTQRDAAEWTRRMKALVPMVSGWAERARSDPALQTPQGQQLGREAGAVAKAIAVATSPPGAEAPALSPAELQAFVEAQRRARGHGRG